VPDPEVAVTLGPSLVAHLSQGDDLFQSEFDVLWSWVARNTGDQADADEARDACFAICAERSISLDTRFPSPNSPATASGES